MEYSKREREFVETLLKDPKSAFAWLERARGSADREIGRLANLALSEANKLPVEARMEASFGRIRESAIREGAIGEGMRWAQEGLMGLKRGFGALSGAADWTAGGSDREKALEFGRRLAGSPEAIAWAKGMGSEEAKKELSALLGPRALVFGEAQLLFAERLDPEAALEIALAGIGQRETGAKKKLGFEAARAIAKRAWEAEEGPRSLAKALGEEQGLGMEGEGCEGLFAELSEAAWRGPEGQFQRAWGSRMFRLGIAFDYARRGKTREAIAAAGWAAAIGAANMEMRAREQLWSGGSRKRGMGVEMSRGATARAGCVMEAALLLHDEELARALMGLGWKAPSRKMGKEAGEKIRKAIEKPLGQLMRMARLPTQGRPATEAAPWRFKSQAKPEEAPDWPERFAERLELERKTGIAEKRKPRPGI